MRPLTCIATFLQVEIEATTKEPGTALRAPTMEAGLVPACKDTCYGDLRLQMWEKRNDGGKGKVCMHDNKAIRIFQIADVLLHYYSCCKI